MKYICLIFVLLLATPAWALNTGAAGMENATPGASLAAGGGNGPSAVTSHIPSTPVAQPQAATVAAPAPVSAKEQGCGDDARLLTIGQWLGGPLQTPPVTISPETFILMAQELMAQLGGQAVICPNVPLLKGGKTLTKVTVPFDLLWNQIQTAALRGDVEGIRQLQASFLAAPLPPEKVVALANNSGLDETTGHVICKGLGLQLRKGRDYLHTLEVFVAVGGKSTKETKVLMESLPTKEMMDKMPAGSLAVKKDMAMSANGEAIATALSRAGLTPGDAGLFGVR